MEITFLMPTRNTLDYTKLAYSSLRLHNPTAEIVMLDDLSTDGTKEWMQSLQDDNLVKWYNDPVSFPRHYQDQTFSGHTITYNIGAQLAKGPLICAFHSDMVATPNFAGNMVKHWKPKTIVSATRIEPPIYPGDNAKIIKDFGIYIQDFKESSFEEFVKNKEYEFKNQITKGFFAPWLMLQDEYLDIGGMDSLYAPYPAEDLDFITRLELLGYDIIQSRDSFVYHWTSRGHRFTHGIANPNMDTEEFKRFQERSMRAFYDKWGFITGMDSYSYPIVPK